MNNGKNIVIVLKCLFYENVIFCQVKKNTVRFMAKLDY